MKLRLFKVLKWNSHPTIDGRRDRWLNAIANNRRNAPITVGVIYSYPNEFTVHLNIFHKNFNIDYSKSKRIRHLQFKEAVLLLLKHSKTFYKED